MSATNNTSTELNGSWELDYITGPRIAFAGLYPKQRPQLVFALPSLEANGHTSCNPFSVKFTLDGNKIIFADARSTMTGCEGIGEQTFTHTLKKINRYNLSDSTLTLIMGDIAMMRFRKKE